MNVILKYGKGGGRGGRTSLFYFDASFVGYLFLFLFFFLLGCSFPSSSLLKGTSLVWLCLYTPVSPSVPEMEGIYATGGILF